MFDYKKKLFFVVLFTLLLTLLLGTYSSCYAISVSDATTVMKEMSTNGTAKTWNNYIKAINDWVTNYSDNQYSCLSSYFNSYDNFVCCSLNEYATNNMATKPLYYTRNMLFLFWNNADGLKYYVSNNKLYFNQSVTYLSVRLDSSSNGQPATISNPLEHTNTYMSNMTNINRCVLYMSSPIYTNNNYTTTNDNINTSLNTGVSLDKWEFNRNGTLSTIYGSQWPYSVLQASNDTNFGSVIDSMHIQQIRWRYASYNNSLGQFGNYSSWYYLYDYNGNGNIALFWPSYSTQVNGKWQTSIHMSTANYQNCIIQLEIISTDSDIWATLGYTYYIKNNNTYISGDIIYPLLTFSGDYNNDYNNQNQNNINQENVDNTINSINNINNTINDDSQVDALLNDFVSGDIATNLGFNPFSNPYHDFLYSFLSGIVDVLCAEQNETLDISFMGKTIILHSEDFTTDANNPIIVFIRIILIFFFIYFAFRFFYSIYVGFEIADIETLKQKLGTDEFYYKDGKYM